MSFSSLPRRLAFLSSSCHRIRSTGTVSTLSALERRVYDDPDESHLDVKIPVNPANFPLFSLMFGDPKDTGLDTDRVFEPDHVFEPDRVLEPSKTESYLSSLLVDGGPPTLRDLERLKPSTHSDPQSKEYALEYSTVLDSICRSFTNDQLRCFSQHYGLRVGSNRRKISYVEAIVEKAWRLPLPKGLKRTRRDRTVISQTLALTASELFILLGKDGSDLSQVSRKYNVHISVKPNPLAIYLEGSPESVTTTMEYVDGVRKDIVEETVDAAFPHPISREVLQKISRLSGAFVENIGHQKLRFRARHPTNITFAQRLATRLPYQTDSAELLVHHIHNQELHTPTTAPVAYALYPFSVPRSLPPMLSSDAFFRWRRVGDWLGDSHSQSLGISGLVDSQGNIFSMDGTEVSLQHRLMGNISLPSYGSRRLISASSGHILFPSLRVSTRPTFLAPNMGGSTYSDTHSWVNTHRSSATFIPSLPLELVHALPSHQRVLHRLVYRCLPNGDQDRSDPIATHFIRLEVPLVGLKQVQVPVDLPGGSILADAMLWSGSSTNLDILMPERQMDLRFNISDMDTLESGQRPGELVDYLNNLEKFLVSDNPDVAQPVPPLRVLYDDREYVLATNASVRQSTESLSLDPSPEIIVTSESNLDLEGGHHSAVCVISSDNLDSPRELNALLQKCDQMTARASPKNPGPH